MAQYLEKDRTTTIQRGTIESQQTTHGAVTQSRTTGGRNDSSSRTTTAGPRTDSTNQTRNVGARTDQSAIHIGVEFDLELAIYNPMLGGGALLGSE